MDQNEMDDEIKQQIIAIFTQTQVTSATHQKCAIMLRKLCDNVPEDVFFIGLQFTIQQLLQVDYKVRNVFAEKVSDFFALFCSSLKPLDVGTQDDDLVDHPILRKIFQYLLEMQNVDSDVVRFRACSLINKILDSLMGTEISNFLYDQIENIMMDRLNDSRVVVRLQAVFALHRLQDPSRPNDPIIGQFINFMNYDSSAKVRLVCIEKIAARRDVISHILTRTRDVDVNVRLAAYRRISKFADYLKISEKRLLIKCGYLDGSVKVKEYVEYQLLPIWLQHYEDDYLKLMQAFRLDADENDIKQTNELNELILSSLFRQRPYSEIIGVVPINEQRLIPFEKLNWETASYWRILVHHLRKNDDLEENTSLVLPELVHFCEYIKSFCSTLSKEVGRAEENERQFIVSQLFLISKGCDLSDTSSRRSLNSLVSFVLERYTFTSSVVQVIVSNLENTTPNIESRTTFVSEIISEIMYPLNSEQCEKAEMERMYQLSQLKVKLNCVMEDQKSAIVAEDYLKAEKLKHEIDELHQSIKNLNEAPKENDNIVKITDIPTICKYLDIASGLLLSPQVHKLTAALEALKNDVIQEMLIHDNDIVRVKAMKCYSLCCIVDRNCAKMGIHIFSAPIFAYKAGEECDTDTLVVCIAAVVDLLRIYGSTLMAEPVGEDITDSQREEHSRIFTGGTSLTELVQGLVDLMDDELPEIQETAGRGLCSLVLSQRVHSPSIIARLVLKWCSPASDDKRGDRLKQMIGMTLENVAKMADSVEQLEGSVLMVIKALVAAPSYSPLADVNIDNIASFLLALCRTSIEGEHIHSNLAMTICCEMRDRPRKKINSIYSKMLLMLDIPMDNFIIRDLLKLCDNLKDDLRDRQALNNVAKFVTILQKKYNGHNEIEGSGSQEETDESIMDCENTIRTV